MKNTFKLLVLFTSISLLSCNEQYTGIKGSGNITKEKRNIEESTNHCVTHDYFLQKMREVK